VLPGRSSSRQGPAGIACRPHRRAGARLRRPSRVCPLASALVAAHSDWPRWLREAPARGCLCTVGRPLRCVRSESRPPRSSRPPGPSDPPGWTPDRRPRIRHRIVVGRDTCPVRSRPTPAQAERDSLGAVSVESSLTTDQQSGLEVASCPVIPTTRHHRARHSSPPPREPADAGCRRAGQHSRADVPSAAHAGSPSQSAKRVPPIQAPAPGVATRAVSSSAAKKHSAAESLIAVRLSPSAANRRRISWSMPWHLWAGDLDRVVRRRACGLPRLVG